jgi:amino acid transporter
VPGEPAATARAPSLDDGTDRSGSPGDVAPSPLAPEVAPHSLSAMLKAVVKTIALLAILFVTILNLRGAKESGVIFAIPTYAFILLMFALL